MTSIHDDAKHVVTQYLDAISGAPKTAADLGRFVSDPALITHITQVEAGFPRYELAADDLIAEGDRVAMRGTFRGVHRGEFAGVPATGQSVSAPLMIVYRVQDGKIAQHWLHFDGAALISQLRATATA